MVLMFAALMVASTAGAVLASILNTSKVTSVVKLVPQTKAELFLEQKEFSFYLLSEARDFKKHSPSSERLCEFLDHLSILTSPLSHFTENMARKCLATAKLAAQTGARLDTRYFALVENLTETMIDSALHATSTNNAFSMNSLQVMKTFATILPALQAYNRQYDLNSWKPGDAAGLVP